MKLDCKLYEEKMKKTVSVYKEELALIRAGRANPMLLAPLTFEYYGSPTPVNTMADIKVTDPKTMYGPGSGELIVKKGKKVFHKALLG